MSRLARHSSGLVALLAALWLTTGARGQNVVRPNRGQPPMREQVRGAGTIKDVGMGLMHVVGAGGDQWLVKLDMRPQSVSFVGSAEESWLHAGLIVRFSGQMDRRGKLLEPLSGLTVVSPIYQIGVMVEGGRANEGPGLFEESKPEKAPAKKPAAPAEPHNVLVVGRLAAFKNGKLTIEAGTGKQLKAELADGARISLELSDLSWVRPGDKVEFDGWAYPQQKNNVFARDVTVTAVQPLTGAKKRPSPKDADNDKEPGTDKEPKKPAAQS